MTKHTFTEEELQVSPFDAAKYLTDEADIAEYLAVSLEDPNPDVFLTALGNVVRAHGMTQLSKETGLAREALYRTFQPGKDPHFSTIVKIMRAIGIQLTLPRTSKRTKAQPARRRQPAKV